MTTKSFCRQPSLTLVDLEMSLPNLQIKETNNEVQKSKKYMEHSAVFDEMVVSTNKEYNLAPPPPVKLFLHRQSSARIIRGSTIDEEDESSTTGVHDTVERINDTGDDGATIKPRKKKRLIRRHSSYEFRQAHASYDHHLQMKEYLDSMEIDSKERKNFVAALLDFNLSVNMASMSDLSMMDKSPGMHYSCPVLSYMNDDEEDSIDLMAYKMNQQRKRGLCAVGEEHEESWESLRDDDAAIEYSSGTTSVEDSKEYQIEIQPLEPDTKPRVKRRRPPSCKVLSDRLAQEHPQQVLRSLGAAL